jgi:hypothetical protein
MRPKIRHAMEIQLLRAWSIVHAGQVFALARLDAERDRHLTTDGFWRLRYGMKMTGKGQLGKELVNRKDSRVVRGGGTVRIASSGKPPRCSCLGKGKTLDASRQEDGRDQKTDHYDRTMPGGTALSA